MFWTTDSLSSAISAVSRARSAQSSHIFLALPSTLTVTSLSASFSHSLQVGMGTPKNRGETADRTLSYEEIAPAAPARAQGKQHGHLRSYGQSHLEQRQLDAR